MPIIEGGKQIISWRDQISEEAIQSLISGMIAVKKYYAIDELHKDVESFLGSTGIYLNGDLMLLIQPIWDANLPEQEDLPVTE